MRGFVFLALCLPLSVACNKAALDYKPAMDTGYGYSDRMISENHYDIQVYGYSHTTAEELKSIFFRRATELCGSTPIESTFKHDQLTKIKDAALVGSHGIPIFIPKLVNKDNFISGSVSCR
jgi:hypothetical protein